MAHDKEALFRAIDNNFFKDVSRYKHQIFIDNPFKDYKQIQELVVEHFLDLGYPLNDILEAYSFVQSSNKRRARCYNKIEHIFKNYEYIYFGTLTFDDKTLNKTTEKTRRIYVSRFLKNISECYIANIDFGDKEKNPDSNEREHYHCLITCNNPPKQWPYGFIKFKRVRTTETDNTRLSKYIVKLSRHSLKTKDTSKAPRLIYSKVVAPSWLFD